MSTELFDEAVHHQQSQPAALPFGYGREEGLESWRDDLGRHAAAGVADGNLDVLAGRGVRVGHSVVIVEVGVTELDRQLAGAVHSVACIDVQIEDGVLNLRKIDEGVPQAGLNNGFGLDCFAPRRARSHRPWQQCCGRSALPSATPLGVYQSEQLGGHFGAAQHALHGIVDAALRAGYWPRRCRAAAACLR